jgi:hypothetical protein
MRVTRFCKHLDEKHLGVDKNAPSETISKALMEERAIKNTFSVDHGNGKTTQVILWKCFDCYKNIIKELGFDISDRK